jgi:hypothetical protein
MNLNAPTDLKQWQKRAEEAWSLAEEMKDAHTKAVMIGIAQSYEKIVKWAEERARPLAMSSLSFTYLCPNTGLRVESFASTNPLIDGHEAVTCVACGRVHLVDPATGKVRQEDLEQRTRVPK